MIAVTFCLSQKQWLKITSAYLHCKYAFKSISFMFNGKIKLTQKNHQDLSVSKLTVYKKAIEFWVIKILPASSSLAGMFCEIGSITTHYFDPQIVSVFHNTVLHTDSPKQKLQSPLCTPLSPYYQLSFCSLYQTNALPQVLYANALCLSVIGTPSPKAREDVQPTPKVTPPYVLASGSLHP